jgi:hypothetical protein
MVSLIPIAAIVLWPEDRQTRLAAICTLALLAAALRYQSALPDLDDPELLFLRAQDGDAAAAAGAETPQPSFGGKPALSPAARRQRPPCLENPLANAVSIDTAGADIDQSPW